jgi:hypothetical protein
MDLLSQASLDWALTHVLRYGDTDIFPTPFEFDAIAHSWNSIREEVSNIDLRTHQPGPARRILVPKPGGGFRVATQLDPVDSIIYAACLYEAADLIEASRIPANRRIACSYRVEIDANGRFFSATPGWRNFHEHSAELAASEGITHVLVADIADFYNQLSVHRVGNALEEAGIEQQRARDVERLLTLLNAKQSQGLPVGPYASILLAEAALNDVDMFLLRKGVQHVRYVDDIRVFCRSRRQAIEIQHDLTEYLHTAHRLSLESYKTSVLYVDRFVREELRDPEEEEKRANYRSL